MLRRGGMEGDDGEEIWIQACCQVKDAEHRIAAFYRSTKPHQVPGSQQMMLRTMSCLREAILSVEGKVKIQD